MIDYKSCDIAGMRQVWAWPLADLELWAVRETVRDVDRAIDLCGERFVALQAGGGCGVWPKYLAQRFERVITFEPDPLNFRCLMTNAPEDNITRIQGALADKGGEVTMENPNADNAGTLRMTGDAGAPEKEVVVNCFKLDDLNLSHLDLLALDVEGGEWDVISGAVETIMASKPVIMVEENGLGKSPQPLLEAMEYEVRARIHRDVIYCPRDS